MHIADVTVIGGGAAGMMSAVAAAQSGASTTLLDKNEKLGKKVFITGHGRCNVTNVAERQAFEQKIFRNGRFMRSALARFGPQDLIEFLGARGVHTKQEDSGRIFPSSDKSSDVIRAFQRELDRLKVRIHLNTSVSTVSSTSDGSFSIKTSRGTMYSRTVVLATGGASYPSTGSTGEGFLIAEQLGHSCAPLRPGLVGLLAEVPLRDLAGMTLGGTSIAVRSDGKIVAREDGDVLFTHSGLSGPAVFRISCALAEVPASKLTAEINFTGGRSSEELASWLTEQAAQRGSSELRTIVSDRVPRRASQHVLKAAELPPDKKLSQLSRAERTRLADAMTAFPLELRGTRPLDEAIITIGGVSTKEINPSTMESRSVPGLFFAGEIIDVSAFTGGYNLQIAFSTGRAAGAAAAQFALQETGKLR